MLSFFALYACKRGKATGQHRIAMRIAHDSSSKNELLARESFRETINLVLKMASTNFVKAAVEIGYMDELYSSNNYASLESSIEAISQDVTNIIFGE